MFFLCVGVQVVSAFYNACRNRGVHTKDGTIVLDLPNLQPGGLAKILDLPEDVLVRSSGEAHVARKRVCHYFLVMGGGYLSRVGQLGWIAS